MSDVVMPQMGESVAEGTIVRWIKRVGDPVDKDEPLFEISTDKVDAEIPAPDGGVLLEIRVQEGETVPVNSVVAVIGQPGVEVHESQSSGVDQADGVGQAPVPSSDPASAGPPRLAGGLSGNPPTLDDRTDRASGTIDATREQTGDTVEERRRVLSSPVVRKIATEHGIDISRLTGTGISGRVTKKDILSLVERGPAASAATRRASARPRPVSPAPIVFEPGASTRVEKMSVMRKKIAEHMVASVRTSPHVFSAYEVDFSRVDALRRAHKARYQSDGARLTYTGFIAKATADTIREFPIANASLDGDQIVYKRDINLGIAVALDQGLIVPVIRNADGRSLFELSRAINDLAERARGKQLKVEDVEGGTFTITNPGIFGGLWGLPIISQPQVAILAVGSIDRRVVVVDDMIAIRPMAYVTMGYDHRLIDGADGGRFLQRLKERLETFDEAEV